MNQKYLIILLAVLLILSLNAFILKPALEKRSVSRVAHAALNGWKNNNLLDVHNNWNDPQTAPPIYDVSHFTITAFDFYKENSEYFAKLKVILEFSNEDVFASGKVWTMLLQKKRRGWTIISFTR